MTIRLFEYHVKVDGITVRITMSKGEAARLVSLYQKLGRADLEVETVQTKGKVAA